uniref:Transmembrane protein n=1 Tax=Cryptomonas curvata TaxID=233186 RepID=A0A7S0M8T9_9CRYP
MDDAKRKWLALGGGCVFGVGWLVFIGSSANYNRCFYADLSRDPCGWGTAVPVVNISQGASNSSTSNSNSSATSMNFDGGKSSIPPGSVGVLGGWEPPSGKIGIVALPGLIALVSLFMVNTVELPDLGEDSRASSLGKLFLKSWLFIGFVLAFCAVAAAIAIFVVIFAQNPLAHNEPGVAAIIQVILILISATLLWRARVVPP